MNDYSNYYNTLIKPDFFPPEYWFGIAWGIIYPMIAIGFIYMIYLIYKNKLPLSVLILFIINMIANISFTPIQFVLKNNELALVDIFIVAITLLIMEFILFRKKLYVLFVIFLPYLLWVLYASFLQTIITWLNW